MSAVSCLRTLSGIAAVLALVVATSCKSSTSDAPNRPGAPGTWYGSGQPEEEAATTWVPGVGYRNQSGNLGDRYGRRAPEPEPARPEPVRPAPTPPPAPAPMPMADATRCTMAFPTGDPATSVVLLETSIPAEVNAGQPFDYEMRVTNLTRMTIEDVVVSDTVQGGFNMAGATPPAAGGAGGAMNWNLGRMAAGETKVIKVTGSAGDTGAITRCAKVTYNSQCCVTTRVVKPALALKKTATPECLACDPIELTFTVSNGGTGAARNVRIEDQLPQGWTTADGQKMVSIDAGTIEGGQSRDFKVMVKSAGTGSFQNTATAKAANGLEAKSNTTTTVVKNCALVITKKAPEKRFIGREIEYAITVQNKGDGVARDCMLEDTLPAGVRFVRASDGGAEAGGKVTWRMGNLEPGATKNVTLAVVPTGGGTLRNTATTRAYCCPPASADASTVVEGIPAVLLEVIDVEDPIEVGRDVTYIITVTNQGSATDTNITIACGIEDAGQFVSASGATQLAGAGGAQFKFAPLPSLAAKAKAEWRVVVKAVKAADSRFKVTLTTDQLGRPVEETESTHLY